MRHQAGALPASPGARGARSSQHSHVVRARSPAILLALVGMVAAGANGAPLILDSMTRTAATSAREQHFATLVAERARAIERAFGHTFAPGTTELRIVFLKAADPAYARLHEDSFYDPQGRTLYFAHHLQFANAPLTSQAALQYWPWYRQPTRSEYPVVETIDRTLWTAVLTEAARTRGLPWPHAACRTAQISERLPCEMLVSGVLAHLTQVSRPLFNENRIAEIWPEDLAAFSAHIRGGDERAYVNVRRYGGYLLLRPLVREFGVARTLEYVARTPLLVEENNLRLSAERYQQTAREALAW